MEDIARLIALLDDETTSVAEKAKAALMNIGEPAVQPLVTATPGLTRYGKLAAVEIFSQVKDSRAARAMIALLSDDDTTVREWAAIALGELGSWTAVPALRSAYKRLKAAKVDLDVTEAVALRAALTALGGRQEVVPPLSRSLRHEGGRLDRMWPAERLADVVEDLAAHGQVVLFFALWKVTDHGLMWWDHAVPGIDVDRDAPWEKVVEAARRATLAELEYADLDADVVVSIEWVDEQDR